MNEAFFGTRADGGRLYHAVAWNREKGCRAKVALCGYEPAGGWAFDVYGGSAIGRENLRSIGCPKCRRLMEQKLEAKGA